MMEQFPEVEIYTDGACSGNPGSGGYGIVLKYKDNIKEVSGGYRQTTNNRMELIAVIKGLEALKKPCAVKIYSDSKYIIDALNKGWAGKWKENGWRRDRNKPAKNADLWIKILNLAEKHKITWVWVKGHDDNIYNNRCDKLAQEASKKKPLQEDQGFIPVMHQY
ncbi:MAG: Ribonuclease H [Desulfotomaculum sp. 46_296]|nr:MAG: Ribonuclease H [Desulfotomaculum sp. 46_296]KUK84812.1 MAG: Ribonuclease H [Desulfofundulus kuznetsovii]